GLTVDLTIGVGIGDAAAGLGNGATATADAFVLVGRTVVLIVSVSQLEVQVELGDRIVNHGQAAADGVAAVTPRVGGAAGEDAAWLSCLLGHVHGGAGRVVEIALGRVRVNRQPGREIAGDWARDHAVGVSLVAIESMTYGGVRLELMGGVAGLDGDQAAGGVLAEEQRLGPLEHLHVLQ